MEELWELTFCPICEDGFKGTPVILTCCNRNICETHWVDALKKQKTKLFKCQFCHKTHNMKNYKFPINEKSQKLLEADMGEIEEEYENAHYEIYYRLKKSIEKMTNLIGDPEYFIFEHVADLKHEIDLRKEKLKEKIDEICDDMIQKMDNYQKECYENAKRAKLAEKNAELIREMQAKLDKWEDIDTIIHQITNI